MKPDIQIYKNIMCFETHFWRRFFFNLNVIIFVSLVTCRGGGTYYIKINAWICHCGKTKFFKFSSL